MGEVHLVEDCEVEVVVVISNGDVAAGSHPNTDGEVGDTFAANLAQVVALVVEHLDAVGPVVANKHLLVVIHCHAVGEFKVPGVAINMKPIKNT